MGVRENSIPANRHPKRLDRVAVLTESAGQGVEVGDVDTVVELPPPDGIEVEFVNRDGRTERVATLRIFDVLVLNREKLRVA